MELRDLMDSGDSVTGSGRIEGLSGWCSIGVGGVTVVAGAGRAVCGGVFGNAVSLKEGL